MSANPAVMDALCDDLGIVALELGPEQPAIRGDEPDWFSGLIGQPDAWSPAFEHFLVEAQDARRAGEPCDSGIFSETDTNRRTHFFRARLRHLQGSDYVIVQRLGDEFAEYREVLQGARENLLGQEALERMVWERTQLIRAREEEIALKLLAAASTRDEETGAHVRRIGLYSEAMAGHLGWTLEERANIRVAAPMHDIGKIGIPGTILKKPGKLDDYERAIMETHARIGADLLSATEIDLLEMAATIALGHHEKVDGSGYPHGLTGESIPVAARIVAIVDVYDALASKRVYKPAFERSEVLAIMADMRGSHFDPDLHDLFVANLDEMEQIRLDNPDD